MPMRKSSSPRCSEMPSRDSEIINAPLHRALGPLGDDCHDAIRRMPVPERRTHTCLRQWLIKDDINDIEDCFGIVWVRERIHAGL